MFAVAVSNPGESISYTFVLSSSSYILSTSSLMFPGLRKYGMHVLFRVEDSITIYSKYPELLQSLYSLLVTTKRLFLLSIRVASVCPHWVLARSRGVNMYFLFKISLSLEENYYLSTKNEKF